jgi:hypothetical protein
MVRRWSAVCTDRLLPWAGTGASGLFSHTQATRIEAETEVSNVAEQRALDKAGWVRLV